MPQSRSIPRPQDARLRLTTLGGASLRELCAHEPDRVLLRPGKALALLVYLAASPRRTASRDHLIDLLWADLHPDTARRALRQAVYFIRHRVGEEILLGSDAELTLAHTVYCDRDEFLNAVESGELDRAVELYHGEFVPGFAAPGGAEFERWADLERDRLRHAFLRTGEALVRQRLSRACWREAERLARRMRDADPLRESTWRLLIESYLSAADAVCAAIEADALEHLLATEQREPEPASRVLLALVRQTARDRCETTGKRTLVAELVGREGEFARIMAAWENACRGTGRHYHITAAAGLGKTRLLNDVHGRLRATGARTVYLRANPGERHIPYVFVADLAARLAALPGAAALSSAAAGALVAVNPSLSSRYPAIRDSAGGDEALRHRVLAIVELLEDVADERPVALLIDDVHWVDATSRRLLLGLLDKVDRCRVLVVTTARPTPGLRAETASTLRITLPPLSVPDVSALLASLGGLPEGDWARALPEQLHAATGGSPLLVLETLQLALERESLLLGTEGWECPDAAKLAAQLEAGSALRHRIEQLAPRERRLLLVLATAGTPLSLGLLAHGAHSSRESAAADLDALEQRGVVMRDGDAWLPAHDEIAALALELAADDQVRATHAALGRALAREVTDDAGLLIRAGRHLAAAEEQRELVVVYRKLVTASRRLGDRRPPAELATELLGEARSPAGIRRLAASLPLHVRLGLTTGRRIAAAGVAALAALGAGTAALVKPNPPPPDAVLIAVARTDDGGGTVYSVPIYRERWEDVTSLDVRARGKRRAELARFAGQTNPILSPDGKSWVFHRTMPDSGELDLFLATDDGSERRLTSAPGDDAQARWAPDGQRLVFTTVRWQARHRADLAILDPTTGELRPLTRGDHADLDPRWSPDGTRIAFFRTFYEMRPPEICWISVDGGNSRCFATPGYVPLGVSGWYDQGQVLALLDSAGHWFLARVHLESASVRVVDGVQGVLPSPDGHWVATFREEQPGEVAGWYVYPVDRPDQARRVEFGTASPEEFSLLWGAAGVPRYLERVRIVAPTEAIPLDATYRLRVQGFDVASELTGVPVLSWWSADTTIATVDSAGTLRPRRTGAVTIHVSAGGWREDSVRVAIRPPGYTTVLDERWTEDLLANWVLFGVPRPRLVAGPEGVPALWHRGDSTYHSGVYSQRAFHAVRGLGMEALVSTPVDALQWQSLTLSLNSDLDVEALGSWDHRTGSPPSVARAGNNVCTFSYPSGDGFLHLLRIALGSAGARQFVPMGEWVRSGRWYTVRLQIFPDGRCAFALNGKPLWRGEGTVSLDRPFRVKLYGKSVRTRILVGPLEVWEGVRGDIDWSVLDRGEGR